MNHDHNKRPDNQAGVTQRRELVASLQKQGKSNRQIAAQLGVDEGTVRRDLKVLQLPSAELASIANGDSAERFLRAAEAERAAREEQDRIALAAEQERNRLAQAAALMAQRRAEEAATENHSNALKEEILSYLLAKQLPYGEGEKILDSADLPSWNAGDLQRLPRRDPSSVFHLCERRRGCIPTDTWERIDFLSKALTHALVLLAPEREIRDRAIKKARAEIIKLTQNQKPSRLLQHEFDIVPLHVEDTSNPTEGREGEVGLGPLHTPMRRAGGQHPVQVAICSGSFTRGKHSGSQPSGEGRVPRAWRSWASAQSRIPNLDPWK